MRNFFNSAQYVSRYSILAVAALVTLITTVAVMAAPDVKLAGDINVKNITDGATTYTESTNADKDDVVRFKIWYTNTELATSTEILAKNVTITVDFPDTLSKTQTVGTTIKGDNTNVINDSSTVNAPTDTSTMLYIPGTAKWQHNVGSRENLDYIFTDLNDNVITEGVPIVIGDVRPSFEFEGWVYFDAVIREGEKPQKPAYDCTALKAVVDQNSKYTFHFTTTTEMSDDVSVNKYVYDFGAGGDKLTTDKAKASNTYEKAGTYNVSVEVTFNVGEGQKTDTCKTSVKITETPPEPPVNPPTPELPNTGPASAIAGIFGTGALGYGAYSFRASRSGLRDKILGKKED